MMTEEHIIEHYFAPLSLDGLKNDGATYPTPAGYESVITTDTMIAGVHFYPHTSPEYIAKRLLRSNLSDLASMGAEPVGYTLNLTLPRNGSFTKGDLESFTRALKDDQQRYNIPLLGGDTTRHDGALILSLTALGKVKKLRISNSDPNTNSSVALGHSGAKINDILYVTGTIGDAALSHTHGYIPHFKERFILPSPRLFIGAQLVGIASACVDISDGLVKDCTRIARRSNVDITLNSNAVPLSHQARSLIENTHNVGAKQDLMSTILTGGDDYELAFTAPDCERITSKIRHISLQAHTPITAIGAVKSTPTQSSQEGAVQCVDKAGKVMIFKQLGYSHD